MKAKLNLKNGDRVVICKVGDDKEHPGTIVGTGLKHITDFYIVRTDGRPFAGTYDYDCVLLSEASLRTE